MNLLHRLAGLNWIAAVLFPVAALLMEVLWLYPWLIWLGKWQALVWQRPPLSLVSLILLLGISFYITRFLTGRQWSLPLIQLSIVLCGLAVIFIVVRIEYTAGYGLLAGQWFTHTGQIILNGFRQPHPLLIALPVGAYLWWRGISLGRSPLSSASIYRSFLVGIGALVVLIIVWRVSLGIGSFESLASTVAPYVAVFFFFSLAGLALANLLAIQHRFPREEPVRLSNRRWLPILFGIVLGIVLVAIGIASIFSPEFLAFLTWLFGGVLDLLRFVIHYLLIPLGYIAAGIYYVMQFLVNLIRGGRPLEPFKAPEFFRPDEMPPQTEPHGLSAIVILAIKWSLFAIAAIVVIFFLVRAITRFRASRAKSDVEQIDESLWSWQGFSSDLRLFFSMLWQRLWRKKKKATRAIHLPKWYTSENIERTLSIREIYQHLLWEASRFGITRRRYETPYEYASRLVQAVPEGSEQLVQLTDIYIDVRYGDREAEDRQVTQANSLWRALRKLLGRPPDDR
jgi:hypothetical protein